LGRLRHVSLVLAVAAVLALVPGLPGDSSLARAQTAAAPSIAEGQFRAGILSRNPNYNNFREIDIKTLLWVEVGGLLSFIGEAYNGYESLIPHSFVIEFGEDATAKFIQALAFDAVRRGQPALYARYQLNGGLAAENNRSNGAPAIDSNVTVNLPVYTANGQTTVETTAPEAFNFAVAATAITAINESYTAETISMINGRPSAYQPILRVLVRVPPEAFSAIVAANPGLPRNIASENYSIPVRDGIAFLAGYASQAGASRNIAPISIPLTDEDFCEAPGIRNDVFRTNAPDVDIGTAFHAGAAMRRYDTMTDAEFARIRATCAD
jgi:hypothetical protein